MKQITVKKEIMIQERDENGALLLDENGAPKLKLDRVEDVIEEVEED
jgi:hypothetical protein